MEEIKLNIGCASRPLPEYVNIDLDTIEEIQERYPNVDIPQDIEVLQYDIFALPYADGAISEIRSDSMLEHLSWKKENSFMKCCVCYGRAEN